jgi:hypothetical protein
MLGQNLLKRSINGLLICTGLITMSSALHASVIFALSRNQPQPLPPAHVAKPGS